MPAAPSPVGLGGFLLFGQNQQRFTAVISQRLVGLRQSATVNETFATTIAQALHGLRQSATVNETFAASITQHLIGLRQSAVATETFASSIAQHIAGLRQSATAGETFSTTIFERLGGLRQSASVTQGTALVISAVGTLTVITSVTISVSGEGFLGTFYSTAMMNRQGIEQGTVTLVPGYNSILVPTTAAGVTIAPDPSSANAKTLKGSAGDVGQAISASRPMVYPFTPGSVATIGISSAGIETLKLFWG